LSAAAGCVLLTLADATTPLHLAGAVDCAAVRDWVRFHIGATLVGAEQAVFAVGRWPDLAPLNRFAVGQPDYPDRSTTLIVAMDNLASAGTRLTGPGIETESWLSLPDTAAFQANRALFPMGLDFVLTCGDRMAAVPRSTRVEDI
jgi:alpha-D-ribose 1-methylphosphonate 5-triphosphate synthase subunit PhnH